MAATHPDALNAREFALLSTGPTARGVPETGAGHQIVMDEIPRLLSAQDGVIARRQALAAGCPPTAIRRLLRRRDWATIRPGVYVNHTGPLTWRPRAWAAVLYDDAVIELADRSPDGLQAIAVLADACGSRHTTAVRLQQRLTAMSRLTRRDWLTAVLTDIADGTCSVLEHAYLVNVERAHGLPHGLRQVAARDHAGRRLFRDVVYGGRKPSWRQIVELDGRFGHDSTLDRDRDLERDLDAALDLTDTVRLGYGQVLGRPCSSAAKLGLLLQRRGWSGAPLACPECQAV